ncbi:glyoxylase-like metal-dependent hydrolase (beta-lactamase superfamily II) [Spinactinospora alkalitolerans]|uniref:Glyoxylase-like metal-dependent hydrolase (Beta-lactamase superfamily II) n=1 Tax=Spinactinospora alkalitolerans TaxID=687207 RepID=A0A852U2Q9_9ACTN|nr:MBL fold metallo-hydrolase [Spinactinospora alkalitolerans]NYE49722.1 glyoxylase-like metal-dependent hydrolase (beta-lactamase superfamily II) [Spinactinospora alkalitolerans]
MTENPPIPVDHLVTSGTFRLDGGEWDVDNNVWIVGNERTAVVIDAAHDHEAIARALGDRELMAIVCTHAHNDHVNAAAALADLTEAPILLHPDDAPLWHMVHPDREPDAPLLHGERLQAGDVELEVLHTPGHAPGAVCLHAAELGIVFTGDTLFKGGPGATGRSYSDFPTIVDSIRDRLLTLPPETVVHTGHGDSTTIGDEAPHLEEWIARGH